MNVHCAALNLATSSLSFNCLRARRTSVSKLFLATKPPSFKDVVGEIIGFRLQIRQDGLNGRAALAGFRGR